MFARIVYIGGFLTKDSEIRGLLPLPFTARSGNVWWLAYGKFHRLHFTLFDTCGLVRWVRSAQPIDRPEMALLVAAERLEITKEIT